MAKRIFMIILISLAGFYLILNLFVYFNQDNMIFFPEKLDKNVANMIVEKDKTISSIEFVMQDNTKLYGWMLDNNSIVENRKKPLIIYYGGNAEELSNSIPNFKRLKAWNVLLVNYRGYGINLGKPSEVMLKSDALEIYNQIIKDNRFDKEKIVIMGRSLGTGIATYVANKKNPRAVILTSPYDSFSAIGKGFYPYIPVKLLLKHRFENIDIAKKTDVKMLALIAKNDDIIKNSHSFNLVKAWKGSKRAVLIDNSSHNTIIYTKEYWKEIKEFLKDI